MKIIIVSKLRDVMVKKAVSNWDYVKGEPNPEALRLQTSVTRLSEETGMSLYNLRLVDNCSEKVNISTLICLMEFFELKNLNELYEVVRVEDDYDTSEFGMEVKETKY